MSWDLNLKRYNVFFIGTLFRIVIVFRCKNVF